METQVEEKPMTVSETVPETASVLLVDDEERNLDVLEVLLAGPGLRLVRAKTAEEALLSLVREEFACVVLDVQMPNMNGIELARLIKTRKRCARLPIIFLTAYFQEERDILQGYGAGAVDYLTKPVNPEILRSKVGIFIESFRTSRALEREVEQRRRVEEELRLANAELESRVRGRTADLLLANSELRAGELRYRQLIQALPAAVFMTDAEGRLTVFNDAAAELWGRRPELGKDLWCGAHKLFHLNGTEMPLHECPMAITLREGKPVSGVELIVERPDGSRRNVMPFPEPIRDAWGNLTGCVNMLLDVTERRRSEEALRLLAGIVESSDEAILSEDLNGIIISWNESATRLFGYKAEEAIGQPITLLMPEERRGEEVNILARLRAGQFVEHFETVRKCKDGSLIDVLLTISLIRNAEGAVVGGSKIVRNITDRKRAERELRRAHEELLAASRAKDDFLAALSHELRTPLNPVLLVASDNARNSDLPENVRADFQMIRENVELEARLIDDLLDLTRVTRGKIRLDKQYLDAHRILQNALEKVREEISGKEITLVLNLRAEERCVFGDAVRLQQVLWNLLKNAAKFTPRGGKVSVETRSDGGTLVIEVADSGIGMKPEEIGRIFKIFSQGDHARGNSAHRYGGLGLGLAISQKLAEFHSGKIRAASDGPGCGSTFTVELPLAKSAASIALPEQVVGESKGDESSAMRSSGLRVLLVEDHEPTRAALTDLLTRRDYEVSVAASVAEARTLAESKQFDMLISDIGLPDGSGYELMSELRMRWNLPGIALTGYGMEQDLALSQNAGFVAHLTKPVRVQCLDATLKEVLRSLGGANAELDNPVAAAQ